MAALAASVLYARAGVAAAALAVAAAPSFFWRLSADADVDGWPGADRAAISTQRGVVPGLVAVGVLALAALAASAFADRSRRAASRDTL